MSAYSYSFELNIILLWIIAIRTKQQVINRFPVGFLLELRQTNYSLYSLLAKRHGSMFTGIVQGTGSVVSIEEKSHFRTHIVKFPQELLANLETGASVAHNGCCLTVTSIDDDLVSFDLIKETLRITNLGAISIGDKVNLERAAKFGDEIGGHQMSGHIICMAEVVKILTTETNHQVWFRMPEEFMKYVLHKGYIGIDGISLTIGEVTKSRFCVHLIPETLARTTLGGRRLGYKVNIEIDPQTQAVVDTVERVLAQKAGNSTY